MAMANSGAPQTRSSVESQTGAVDDSHLSTCHQSGDWRDQAVSAAYSFGALPTDRPNTTAPYLNFGIVIGNESDNAIGNTLASEINPQPTQQTITVDGGNRQGTATLMLPDHYDPDKKYPLVVALHGYQGNVTDISNMMNLERLRQEGNIVLVPAGQNHGWNGAGISYLDGLFGAAKGSNGQPINDVDFVRSAIGQVESEYNVNKNDITVAGFSQGGQLAYELAGAMDSSPSRLGSVRTLVSAAGSDPDARAGQILNALRGTNIVQYEPGDNWEQNLGDWLTGDPSVSSFLPRLEAAKQGVPNPSGDSNQNGVQITSYRENDGTTITELFEKNGQHAWPGQPKSFDNAMLGKGSISHVELTDYISNASNAYRNS